MNPHAHPSTTQTAADSLSLPLDAIAAAPSLRSQYAAVVELTKPRITRLVTITAAVGFVLAAAGPYPLSLGPAFLELLFLAAAALVGTALSAAGANALNQWMERRRDSIMPRTARRPLPQSRISPPAAFGAGVSLCVAGVAVLAIFNGPAPALVSLATILSYLLLYTPLKPYTPLATLVGAIPGALPPLIGWTAGAAAIGSLSGQPTGYLAPLTDPGGWSLFMLMLVWQIPHFLAIAWMYRDDYAAGGYKVLPVTDPPSTTSVIILVWTLTLLPATLAPALIMPDRLGTLYLLTASLSGLLFAAAAARLAHRQTRDDARRVFIASVLHLPLLIAVMVADAALHTFL